MEMLHVQQKDIKNKLLRKQAKLMKYENHERDAEKSIVSS